MTNTNVQVNESRKKYLVPVVVLLFCMVSLAGAAYAYSSSVTTQGTATANEFYIDLYTAGGESATVPVPIAGADVVTFTTDMDYVDETVVIKANPANKNVATAYLKVTSSVPGQTNAKIKFESALVTLEAPALAVGMTLQASVSSVTQNDTPITADGAGYYTVAVGTTVVMTIFLTIGGEDEWTFDDLSTYATAQAAADAFHADFESNAKFKFTVTAENIVTP